MGRVWLPLSITFSDISRAYHLCKKEVSPTAVKLYGFDGDYLTSMLASQIDLVFPFKHLVLTSDDLNQKPDPRLYERLRRIPEIRTSSFT